MATHHQLLRQDAPHTHTLTHTPFRFLVNRVLREPRCAPACVRVCPYCTNLSSITGVTENKQICTGALFRCGLEVCSTTLTAQSKFGNTPKEYIDRSHTERRERARSVVVVRGKHSSHRRAIRFPEGLLLWSFTLT